MEKTHSDHLIQQRGFVSCEFEGKFLKDRALDFYESKLLGRSVKIMGYVYDRMGSRIILDTRTEKDIPFDYIYTYSDHMHKRVGDKVWQDRIDRNRAANAAQDAKIARLSVKGSRVFIFPRYYLRQNFREGNGTVVVTENGYTFVDMDHGGPTIVVETEQLDDYRPSADPKEKRKMTLFGERNILLNRLEGIDTDPPFGPDNRKEIKRSLLAHLERVENELTSLGVPA
jgi:hypothetical protein